MKKLFLLLLLSAASLCAQSETVALGPYGKLTLYLPGDWKIDVSDLGGRTVTIKPAKESVNADCTLSITFPEQDQYSRKDKLKMRVEVNGEQFAQQSAEGKAVAKPFDVKSGFGFHCDFTDPDLVGKPPQKGNFKTLSAGTIRLAPHVLIDVVIEADGFSSEPYQQLLGAIEGMEFEPGKEAGE